VTRPPRPDRLVPGGDSIFQRIFTRIGCQGRPPQFIVEYHPYSGLTHTIRIREEVARVRLSDVMRAAPLPIVEAIASILLGRLYRKPPNPDAVQLYREFSQAHGTRQQIVEARKRRARRVEHRPTGSHHDLDRLFHQLNHQYFQAALQQPRLGWSSRRWTSQLGCFDPALNQIVLNRRLDDPRVPEHAVAYVLYHEMLHVKHPIRFVRCRRESHSSKFRREEKLFADYVRATKFLKYFGA
jgi:hypothetical protein